MSTIASNLANVLKSLNTPPPDPSQDPEKALRRLGLAVLLITHDVEEAIYMADRIMVMSPRPTTIQRTFDVSLPHPRKLSSPEAQSLREAILKELGLLRVYTQQGSHRAVSGDSRLPNRGGVEAPATVLVERRGLEADRATHAQRPARRASAG